MMKPLFAMLCGLLCLMPMLMVQAQDTPIDIESTPTPTPPPAQANSPVRAEFVVDNETPLLGEPFTVSLVVTAPRGTDVLNWATFELPIEVLEESEVEIAPDPDDETRVQLTKTYDVVLWEVGDYLSQGVLLGYDLNGVQSSTPVSSFFVQVPSQVLNTEDAVIRPATPPIRLPYISPWWYVSAIAGLAVLAMLVARVLQIGQRGMVEIVAASPAEKAIAELEDMKEQSMLPATRYELVANTLRRYIQGQFEVEAVEMTTQEVVNALRQIPSFPKPHRRKLQDVLEQADLVKFAKAQPDDVSSFRLVNFAIKWLMETERLQQHG